DGKCSTKARFYPRYEPALGRCGGPAARNSRRAPAPSTRGGRNRAGEEKGASARRRKRDNPNTRRPAAAAMLAVALRRRRGPTWPKTLSANGQPTQPNNPEPM